MPLRLTRRQLLIAAGAGAIIVAVPAGIAEASTMQGTSTSRYPADAGQVDVTLLGADPTGRTDCTAIVLAAIQNHGPGVGNPLTLYWPTGTYLVSAPLYPKTKSGAWCCSVTHQGDGASKTFIRLADETPGYNNPNAPLAVLYLASQPENGETFSPNLGQGNGGFHNFVFDLTVDVGNNAGAIGIDYLANNVGSIRRTSVMATSGAVGINMVRQWPGPCILDDVTVTGAFAVGASIEGYFYSVMLESCRFSGQTVPVSNGRNVVGMHNCTFDKALQATNGNGVFVFVPPAPGRTTAATVTPTATGAGERNYGLSSGDFAAARLSGPLTPSPTWDAASLWVNAHSQATLQDAVNVASTVYYPAPASAAPGALPGQTITLPTTLNRLTFMDSGPSCAAFTTGIPVFETTGTTSEPLIIERGYMRLPSIGNPWWIQHNSTRPLVITDITLEGGGTAPLVQCGPGAGPVYVDNALCTIGLVSGNNLIARQLNWEGTVPAVTNNGGTAWIMGLKTENGQSPILQTAAGGRSELYAGEFYPVNGVTALMIPVVTTNASHVVEFCTWSNGPNPGVPEDYNNYVQTTQNGVSTTLGRSSFSPRGYGTAVLNATSRGG